MIDHHEYVLKLLINLERLRKQRDECIPEHRRVAELEFRNECIALIKDARDLMYISPDFALDLVVKYI